MVHARFRRCLLPGIVGAAILVGVTLNVVRSPDEIRNSYALEYEPERRQLRKKTADVEHAAVASPTPKFSFGYTSEDPHCIPPEDVEGMASTLRELYEKHGVRVIPRNGFLLGIIRHGGFLPNEKFPDADLGIVSTDVDRVAADPGSQVRRGVIRLAGEELFLSRKRNEDDWVTWKGRNPAVGLEYPYFGVRITRKTTTPDGASRIAWAGRANTVYPYEKHKAGGGFFFPRLDTASYNHRSHVKEMLRYNREGANYRHLGRNELVTKANVYEGKQIGTVFDTDLECMMLTQFYFTSIYVPCDYEKILVAYFGTNWNHVENRGGGGKGNRPAMKLSEEEDLRALRGGPKPLCSKSPRIPTE